MLTDSPSLMPKSRLLDPTLDLNFKRVFSTSPELLTALINAVRWNCPAITVEAIQNPEIVPNDLGKKLIVLDVLARDETGRLFNIELQTRAHMGLPARLVFYLARVLVNEFGAGEDYRNVPPVVGITLLDFDMFSAQEQALWRFELRDELSPDVILDRCLSLHVVEMPKAERLASSAPSKIPQALSDWLTWLRHANEENDMLQQIRTPEVLKAHERLISLSQDPQAWVDAAQRESALSMEATLLAQAEREKTEANAKGRTEGQTSLLIRLLHTKFGDLSPVFERQLQEATQDQLEHWADRVLTAETLEQVFSHH